MGRFMLSFERGRPIAIAVDENNKIKHIIKVIEKDNKDDMLPDIDIDNIFDIMNNDDIERVGRALKLSRIEKKVLKRALRKRSDAKLNDRLKDAYHLTLELLNDKLKNELEFDNNLRVLPVLGYNDRPFDRHIFIGAASGSGKSFFTGDLLKFDKMMRPILLISKVEKDKAFEHLLISDEENEIIEDEIKNHLEKEDEKKKEKKKKKKEPNKRRKQYLIKDSEDLIELPNLNELTREEGLIVVFDDIDTFKPEIADFLRRYMNDLLETGRHKNITTISTSHEIKGYNRTKKNMNEAQWVVLFPYSNQLLASKFLKDGLGLLKSDRDRIINKASRNRYMAVKTSTPLAVIHQRGIILL